MRVRREMVRMRMRVPVQVEGGGMGRDLKHFE